jgi:hypothetical protein
MEAPAVQEQPTRGCRTGPVADAEGGTLDRGSSPDGIRVVPNGVGRAPARAANRVQRPGGRTPSHDGPPEVRLVPYQPDQQVVAPNLRPADADVDAARVDTFTSTVFVATTCATPAVATAASDIPDQNQEERTRFPVRPGGDNGNSNLRRGCSSDTHSPDPPQHPRPRTERRRMLYEPCEKTFDILGLYSERGTYT